MSRHSPASPSVRRPTNRLLSQLSAEDFRHVRPHLKAVTLRARQVLYQQGERVRHVYFPNGGVISMATVLPEGAMVEAATIGDDGIVGIEAFFGGDPISSCETIVQVSVAGESAERMGVEDFRRELAARATLHRAVSRYVGVMYGVTARLIACNSHHQMEARCARWLLTMHDRVRRQEFRLSHELLAAMLGVRRQSVTIVAGALRSAGLIQYVHGRITILNRRGLEAVACECYPAIRALNRKLET